MPKFIVVEEEKFKFNSFILQEFDIVDPVCILFACYLYQRAKGFYLKAVADENKAFPHEYLIIFLLANQG